MIGRQRTLYKGFEPPQTVAVTATIVSADIFVLLC